MPLEHIHPMLVHFPIVLALLALAFDGLWLMAGRNKAAPIIRLQTGTIVFTLGALGAIAAFAFGDLAYDIAVTKGIAPATLESHEGWGSTTTMVFVAVAALRLVLWWRGLDQKPVGIFLAVGGTAVVAAMILVSAYFGGHLVYDLGVNIPLPK